MLVRLLWPRLLCRFASLQFTFIMPTNAKFAKRLADLVEQFHDRLNKLVEKLVDDVKGQEQEEGLDCSTLNNKVLI